MLYITRTIVGSLLLAFAVLLRLEYGGGWEIVLLVAVGLLLVLGGFPGTNRRR